MKVAIKNGLPAVTGKYDEVVYYYVPGENKVYARKRVYPELSAQHEKVGSISSRIYGLKPSEGYKLDLGYYLLGYNSLKENRERQLRSWSSLYLRIMYRMAELHPEIDLKQITREEIFANELPCRSVKTAVLAGLIPEVPGWEIYDREM